MEEQPERRRAGSLAEMRQIQSRLFLPEQVGRAISGFHPEPSDVVIAPFGKSGTTWLQQVFHTLRTRGDIDFDDISRVVPWIETAEVLGLDLGAPQRAEPRGFKSHLPYDAVPKGGRYVISFRDPKDVVVSLYRFMEGWFLEPGAVSLDTFARNLLQQWDGGADYWGHLLSWWRVRDQSNVLLFTYEQMSADPAATIRNLAAFCQIPLDDELLHLALERTSLDYMLLYKDRFDDRLMREASELRCNLPAGSDSAKVRKGKVGGHREELSEDIGETLDAIWRKRVTPETGFDDYAAFDAAVRLRTA